MTFKSVLFENTYNELLEAASNFIKDTPREVVDFLVIKGGIALYDSVWRDSAYQRVGFVSGYLYSSSFSDDELDEQLALYKEQYETRDKICDLLAIYDKNYYLRKIFNKFHECEKNLRETYAPILALRTSAGYQCFSQLKRQDAMWNKAHEEVSVIANAMFTFLCRKAWDEVYSKA